MAYSPSVAAQLLDLMSGLGNISNKKMFGALGFYQGPTIFGCLFNGDIFYLKATGAFAEELKANGSTPFIYEGKSGKAVNMPYWTAPDSCLDDQDEMELWCKKALVQAALPKPPKNKPRKKT